MNGGRAGRIVLIDDDKTFRKILSQGLGELGYRIEELDGTGDVVGEAAARGACVISLGQFRVLNHGSNQPFMTTVLVR